MSSRLTWWEPTHTTPPLHDHPLLHPRLHERDPASRRYPPPPTVAVGAFYACMAGVHLGLVSADPQVYSGFAEASPWGWVRTGWSEVFMADPAGWGLFTAALELTLAALLFVGGRPARLGWVGVIAFQLALLPFGWGFLLWVVPATLVLVAGARRDWAALGPQSATEVRTSVPQL